MMNSICGNGGRDQQDDSAAVLVAELVPDVSECIPEEMHVKRVSTSSTIIIALLVTRVSNKSASSCLTSVVSCTTPSLATSNCWL
jgi:hypothetical protein